MVAAAVRTLGRRPLDVVLVVRGGGARADLATFDSEAVARAIASCPVPVVTGLGHEVDRSVADEVACLALKTPTACAAELVDRVRRFRQGVEGTWDGHRDGGRRAADRSGAGAGRHGPPGGPPDPRLAGDRLGPPGRARRTAAAPGPADARAGHDHAGRRGASGPGGAPPARPRPRRRELAAAGRSPPPPVARPRPGRGADRWTSWRRGCAPSIRRGRWPGGGASPTPRTDGSCGRPGTSRPGDRLTTTLADGQVHSRVEGTGEESGAVSTP